MRKYKELKIWQRSVDLAASIYEITSSFPKEEKFGLISQMRRASVSVPSNIVEGAGRSSDKDFKRFIDIAYGSLYELQTQVIISTKLNLLDQLIADEIENEIIEIQKMMYTYAQRFN